MARFTGVRVRRATTSRSALAPPRARETRCALAAFERSTVSTVSEPLHLTIVYEDGGDGWTVASVPEVPGVHSQGRTRDEARSNVIDALHGILELRFGEHALKEPAADSESLELVIAA